MNSATPPKPTVPKDFAVFGLMAALVLATYFQTLGAEFVLDDKSNIENSPAVHLTSITIENILQLIREGHVATRPVANLSFGLNYYLHRFWLPGWHLVNMAVHAGCGVLLYLLLRATMNLPVLTARYGQAGLLPLAVALAWLLNPVHSQTVAYTVQRMTSLAALFYLLSLYSYLKARLTASSKHRFLLYLTALFSGLLALLSKETAATLPLFIFLYEWFFLQNLSTAWRKRYQPLLLAVLLGTGLLCLFYLGATPIEKILHTYASRDFTLTERILTESRVVLFYLSLLFFPLPGRLALEHDFPLSVTLFDPATTIISIIVIAVAIGFALVAARRQPLISFCILWYFGNLAIESSFIGLEIIFEHRTYLPSMLAILPVFHLGTRLLSEHQRLKTVAGVGVLLLLAAGTIERNRDWQDVVVFWTDNVAKSPNLARPRVNLGISLKNRNRLDEAINQYQEAIRLDPTYPEARYNLGNALLLQGRFRAARDIFESVLRLTPHDPDSHYHLGYAQGKLGQFDAAIYHYREAIRLRPDFTEARQELAGLQRFIREKIRPAR